MTARPLTRPFSTEEIRSIVAWQDNYPYDGEENELWAAGFDRWLAGVKAEVIRDLASLVAAENPGVSKITADNWARWIRSHADHLSPGYATSEKAADA